MKETRPIDTPAYAHPRRGMDLEKRGFLNSPYSLAYMQANFSGDFDGGDIGEPDELNSYLLPGFDGGAI